MPLRLNRVALGLLSYLDAKNAGQPPQAIDDAIRCTLELGPFLSGAQQVDMFGQVAAANTGAPGIALASNFMGVGGGAFQVPPGELWLVKNVTARMGTLPAATTYQFTVGWQSTLPGIAGGAVWYSFGPGVSHVAFATGTSPSIGYPCDVVLGPGDQLGIHIQVVTVGTAQNVDVACRAVRLLV